MTLSRMTLRTMATIPSNTTNSTSSICLTLNSRAAAKPIAPPIQRWVALRRLSKTASTIATTTATGIQRTRGERESESHATMTAYPRTRLAREANRLGGAEADLDAIRVGDSSFQFGGSAGESERWWAPARPTRVQLRAVRSKELRSYSARRGNELYVACLGTCAPLELPATIRMVARDEPRRLPHVRLEPEASVIIDRSQKVDFVSTPSTSAHGPSRTH